MNRFTPRALAVAVALAWAPASLAQDAPPPATAMPEVPAAQGEAPPGQTAPAKASPTGPSEARLKLAHRLLDDMGGTANLKSQIDAIASTLVASMVADRHFAPETTKALNEAMSESLANIVPRIVDEIAKVYAEDFDEAELSDIAAFYEGPAGKAWVAKLPALSQQSGVVGAELVPELQADLLDRFCRKINCTQDQKKTFRPQIG